MKRALLSVSDKRGIVEFATELKNLGWEILSTGGTFKLLAENGLEVKEVSEITEFPEILDGRVKTLHPNVHGGILYRRDLEEDVKTIEKHGIGSIDMVVVNLYPFKEAYEDDSLSMEEKIEQIDIGGPSMVRAAAKNFKYVNIVVNSEDYEKVLEELKSDGKTSFETRMYLAKRAFAHTARYDSMISAYFNEITGDEFPDSLILAYEKESELRYGENPHQKAASYTEYMGVEKGLKAIKVHQGKELSYNNIGDFGEAVGMIKDFDEPTVIAIKHGNPCGISSDKDVNIAYNKAHDADPQSIFGGILIANREINGELAKDMNKTFLEIVIAPSFTETALEEFNNKKNLRVIEYSGFNLGSISSEKMLKFVEGGLLVQDTDSKLFGDELNYATKEKPSEKELEDLEFAWKAVKNVKSNAIVLAKDKTTIAIGPGQVSRVWALENAVKQAKEMYGEDLDGVVLASDGFFPFSDCVEYANANGIKAVIQPGGSKNDSDSIDVADKYGMKMVLTGIRHFKH